MTMLYYEAPSQEIFDDMKRAAIELWSSYDDTHGYATEKIAAVRRVQNVKDNFMYIFAMFDFNNQRKLTISQDTRRAVNDRLISGGSPEYLLI